MRPLYGLLLLTFRKLWAKRIVLGLFVVSSLVLLALIFALNLEVVEGTLQGLQLFGEGSSSPEAGPAGLPQRMSLADLVVGVEAIVAGAAYWVGILLALFASSGLFSDLQAPGRAELLLSKPVSRLQVLCGHALGVWLVIAALLTYLMGGTWLIMSLKSGVWNPRFLWSILLVIGMFAVMYAAVMLMGVWTESTALTLMAAYGLIFISLVLAGADEIVPRLSPTGKALFWGLYYLFPNFAEVTTLVTNLAKDTYIDSWSPLLSSLLFGAGTYALAGYFFFRRDF